MTVRQWWENYWYHYKWHTVIGVLLVLTLAVGVTQCALRTPYDQNGILYCNRMVSAEASTRLQEALAERIPDENGDGNRLFEVYNVSYRVNTDRVQQADFANAQKIMALVSSADYVLYMVDDTGYHRLMVEDNMQLFETYDFLPHQNGTAWNWKGSPLQKQLQGQLPEDLYFCIRKVQNTAAQDDAKAAARAQQAAALIRALMEETAS